MKTAVFNNKVFFSLLIGFILLLLLYNSYSFLKNNNVYAIIPICAQVVLLAFIFTRNKHLRIILIIWAMTFLIIAPGLDIIASVLDEFNGDSPKLDPLIIDLVYIIIGVLIYTYAKKTISISTSNDI